MSQQPIDPLEPQGLPTDPREAAMLLLGMTASELKSIDEKVVSGRNSVGGTRSDIRKIVTDIRSIQPTRANTPPPIQEATPQTQQPTPIVVQDVTPQVQPPPAQISRGEVKADPNQLEFDFYRKIKPEDIEYQLRLIKSSIDNLETKVNNIIDILKKKDQLKNNGDISQ